MPNDRLTELEALVTRLSGEVDTLRTRLVAALPKPDDTAAQLFPGKWRKQWIGTDSEGSEEFTVNGYAMQLTKTSVGVKACYRLTIVSDDGDEIRLLQKHRSELPCFPTCEITVKRSPSGYIGTELANGKTVRVTYEPVAG